MEKLLQVAALALSSAYLCCAQTAPSGHCSLTVIVTDNDRNEVEAQVSVLERGGRLTEKETEPGGARFCDLGILPVTVSVGLPNSCNYTVVHNVPLEWNETYKLIVVQDASVCEKTAPPPPKPFCTVLLRTLDRDGSFLSGVEVRVSSPVQEIYSTDSAGRVLLSVEAGKEILVELRSRGRLSQSLSVPCKRETRRIEREVVLPKIPE